MTDVLNRPDGGQAAFGDSWGDALPQEAVQQCEERISKGLAAAHGYKG